MEEKVAFNKFFHDYISNKAVQLDSDSEAFGQIEHRLTKGVFREYSLMNFLGDLMPIPFRVGKGIISDCTGAQSPETDVLIFNENLLPPILLSESVGVFPYETVRYFFEVKTTVDAAAIGDFCDKLKRFHLLVPLQNYGPNFLTPPLPLMFGYGTTMTIERIFAEFSKSFPDFYNTPPIVGVCILGFGYLSFVDDRGEPGKKWLFVPADSKRYEIVSLVAGILNTLMGRNLPSFGYYIMQNEATGRGRFI